MKNNIKTEDWMLVHKSHCCSKHGCKYMDEQAGKCDICRDYPKDSYDFNKEYEDIMNSSNFDNVSYLEKI